MKTKDQKRRIVTGTHILGEIVSRNGRNLKKKTFVKNVISKLIREYGLTELGSVCHEFPGGGFTLVTCLTESHISLHTWPELKYATLDVFLCNYSRDNTLVCKKVFNRIAHIFLPTKIITHVITR